MSLHKHQLYLLEQHSESFTIWSAIIRIYTEVKSLIMKLGPAGFLYQRSTLSVDPENCWPNVKWVAVLFLQIQVMFI